jgi:hypothetical protein
MAVSDKPNSAYILDTLVADLENIKRPDYWSDVETVRLPNYGTDDKDRLYADCAAEGCHVRVWLDYSGSGDGVSMLGGHLKCTLGVIVVGVVKAGERLQERTLMLAEDVRRAMMTNPMRYHPDVLTTNTWGVNTEYSRQGFDFVVDAIPNAAGIGLFLSTWEIGYKFPTAKG